MKKLIAVTAVALALSACSMRGVNQPLEVWQNYKSSSVSASGLGEDRALAVFYRQNNVAGPAVNVYINGDYQASLLSNSFTAMETCGNKQRFSSSYVTNQQFGNRTSGASYDLPTKQISYFRITNSANGQPVVEPVSEEVGKQAVANLKQADQTLSRAKIRCTEVKKEVVLDKISLSAGALFGLNKSGYSDILSVGKQEIAAFAEKLKSLDASKVDKVVVSGYTDPEGSDAYNQSLSQKRAEAVSYGIKSANVPHKVVAIGYGKADLIVGNCHTIANKTERAACNQPNRRVEITVYGK